MKARRRVRPKIAAGILWGFVAVQLFGCAWLGPRPAPPLETLNSGASTEGDRSAAPESRPVPQVSPPPEPIAPPAPPPATHASAPATPPPASPATPKTERQHAFLVHTVKWPGETLSAVAAWYTGDQKNWKVIAESNPEINAARIQEGNRISIPEALLKTREAMPREFVDRYSAKPRKDKPSPKTQPVEQQQDLQLFGPRKSPSR